MFEPFFGQLLSCYLGRQNAHKAYFTFQDGPQNAPKTERGQNLKTALSCRREHSLQASSRPKMTCKKTPPKNINKNRALCDPWKPKSGKTCPICSPKCTQFWGKLLPWSALERAMQPLHGVLNIVNVLFDDFWSFLLLIYALPLFLLPTSRHTLFAETDNAGHQ